MTKAILLACAFTLLMPGAPTQAQDYLGDHAAFFEKKSQLYQHWLDANGLGEALKVDDVRLEKNDTELELFLSLRTTDPDTAAALWTSLNSSFSKQNGQAVLGAELFRTFVRMMEIPPAQGNVQVYFPRTDGPGYNPCFFAWFWEQDGEVKEKSRINNCKAQSLSVAVKEPKLRQASNQVRTAVSSRDQAGEVFDKIMEYARRYYKPRKHYEREPQVLEENRSEHRLEFSVTDLSKEVLTAEDLSAWCQFFTWLGYNCNDMRRERLEFEFYYYPTDGGYQLVGKLTGKFGSGVYRPYLSGYMDMDPDFEENFLKPYAKKFQQNLKQYLENN